MDRATFHEDCVVADGLPLERLYARFDAMAKGLTKGDSSSAHLSLIQRFATNQRRAEALGWTGFVLERRGGSGRLELRGSPAPGRESELVPDQIPPSDRETTSASTGHGSSPRFARGRIGSPLANVSWRSRMRWLDDGGR